MIDAIDTQSEAPEVPEIRKPYETPKLTDHGAVGEMTLGTNVFPNVPDVAGFSS